MRKASNVRCRPPRRSPGVTGPASAGAVAEGGDQPHATMPPFQTINCIIALQGILPSRS
jgi:microcystin-dependent protein